MKKLSSPTEQALDEALNALREIEKAATLAAYTDSLLRKAGLLAQAQTFGAMASRMAAKGIEAAENALAAGSP